MDICKFIFGETLEQALESIPEEYQLKYYRIIKDYGLHGIEPELTGFELATWVQMKAMIDITMPKKNNASPVSKVGAPFGNKNAQKTIKNNQNNYDELFSENNQNNSNNQNNLENNSTECLNGNVNENVNANGNGNGNGEKQPPPLLFIKNKIKERGFFLDDDRLLERLIIGTDPPWFEGGNSFIDFIAETVREGVDAAGVKYGDKPAGEQHRIFRKLLFDAPNLRDEYPEWRRQQERNDALRACKEKLESARKNRPIKCRCGGVLGDYLQKELRCFECYTSYIFDEEISEWVPKAHELIHDLEVSE